MSNLAIPLSALAGEAATLPRLPGVREKVR